MKPSKIPKRPERLAPSLTPEQQWESAPPLQLDSSKLGLFQGVSVPFLKYKELRPLCKFEMSIKRTKKVLVRPLKSKTLQKYLEKHQAALVMTAGDKNATWPH